VLGYGETLRVDFNGTQVFCNAIRQFSLSLTNIKDIAFLADDDVDDVTGFAREVISNLKCVFGSIDGDMTVPGNNFASVASGTFARKSTRIINRKGVRMRRSHKVVGNVAVPFEGGNRHVGENIFGG